jgi:hypothetical protein
MYILAFFAFSVSETKNDAFLEKGFTWTALIGTMSAIISDAGMEYYYSKYREAKTPSECERYRDKTQLLNATRNISIVAAGVSLGGLFLMDIFKEKKNKENININIKPYPNNLEVQFSYFF